MNETINVLLISSSKDDLKHYGFMLKDMGADLTAAGNSSEAIRLLGERVSMHNPFHIVMTSYILPDRMTALTLTRKLIGIQTGIKVMIFPAAELFEQEVMAELEPLAGNMLAADLSHNGLKKMLSRVRKEIIERGRKRPGAEGA